MLSIPFLYRDNNVVRLIMIGFSCHELVELLALIIRAISFAEKLEGITLLWCVAVKFHLFLAAYTSKDDFSMNYKQNICRLRDVLEISAVPFCIL